MKITQSALLIRSPSTLTVTPKRIFGLCLHGLKQESLKTKEQKADAKNRTVVITADLYAQTFGLSHRNAYAEMKRGAKALTKATWWKTVEEDGKEIHIQTSYVSRCTYIEGEARLHIELDANTVEELIALDKQYASYDIGQVASIKSIHTYKLMEVLDLESYRDQGEWRIQVAELREMLGVHKGKYTTFSNFRRFVLEKAIAELNEQTHLTVSYEIIRQGRKATAIKFKIQNPKIAKKREETKKAIKTLRNMDLIWSELKPYEQEAVMIGLQQAENQGVGPEDRRRYVYHELYQAQKLQKGVLEMEIRKLEADKARKAEQKAAEEKKKAEEKRIKAEKEANLRLWKEIQNAWQNPEKKEQVIALMREFKSTKPDVLGLGGFERLLVEAVRIGLIYDQQIDNPLDNKGPALIRFRALANQYGFSGN